MDQMLGPKKRKKSKQEKLEEALGPNAGDVGDLVAGGDAKIEDLEAPPAWEADPNEPPDSPVDISSRFVVVCFVFLLRAEWCREGVCFACAFTVLCFHFFLHFLFLHAYEGQGRGRRRPRLGE